MKLRLVGADGGCVLEGVWVMFLYLLIHIIVYKYINIQLSTNMEEKTQSIELKLMGDEVKEEEQKKEETPGTDNVVWHEFQYKQFGNAPKIQLSGLTLIILCPILICLHFHVARFAAIPMIQFAFVSVLVAFIVHYTLIIRRYELMPYLPENIYDFKLKKICVAVVIGLIWAMMCGWNGSGGILFAMGWESVRGNRMDFYGYMLLVVVIGCIALEDRYTWWKLMEFVPAVLFGYVNSTLYTLKQSSVYAITHQMLFLGSISLPMFFPARNIIVPSVVQWGLMLVCGLSVLATVVLTVKLMQTERVSVVMAVFGGILMAGTAAYLTTVDYIGLALVVVGIILLIKKQFFDLRY